MSDKAKILAEGVMGWTKDYNKTAKRYFYKNSEHFPWCEDFDPENNDSDLMMCWDRFSEGRSTEIRHVFAGVEPQYWVAFADIHDPESILGQDYDRRTAMVDCMVRSLEEVEG